VFFVSCLIRFFACTVCAMAFLLFSVSRWGVISARQRGVNHAGVPCLPAYQLAYLLLYLLLKDGSRLAIKAAMPSF
jgi:hypothetical protein